MSVLVLLCGTPGCGHSRNASRPATATLLCPWCDEPLEVERHAYPFRERERTPELRVGPDGHLEPS